MYRAAVIGCGRIAGELEQDQLRHKPCTHAGAYQTHKRFELLACCAREEQKAKEFAAQFQIPHFYDDPLTMLQQQSLDVVSICTPAATHAELVKICAQQKVPVIICEKALATSVREAQKMIKLCARKGSRLIVNHSRRWDWNYLTVKEWLIQGLIGRLQSVHAHFSGHVVHTGTHLFDLLLFLVGEPESIDAQVFKSTQEGLQSSGYKFLNRTLDDFDAVGEIWFRNGVVAFVQGLSKKHFVFELDLMGSEGRIRVGNGLLELWQMQESSLYEGFKDLHLQAHQSSILAQNHWLRLLDEVHMMLLDPDKQSQSSSPGEAGRDALALATAFHISAAKRETVFWPLQRRRDRKKRIVSH